MGAAHVDITLTFVILFPVLVLCSVTHQDSQDVFKLKWSTPIFHPDGEHCCGAMEGLLSSLADCLTLYPCLCICGLFVTLSLNACNRQKLLGVATGFITTLVSHEVLLKAPNA
ncbi:hypothetical protein T10_4424 [Trichinella papuae]|uniref:Uncharacterized protein n=1 Tax=Trichinella papuae TaxID=268474 RepID=A0A0V1MK84_9BILA|nr:hypothetical protein T10_4424 [Trichinella papuae]